jgi:hypothetical protein
LVLIIRDRGSGFAIFDPNVKSRLLGVAGRELDADWAEEGVLTPSNSSMWKCSLSESEDMADSKFQFAREEYVAQGAPYKDPPADD